MCDRSKTEVLARGLCIQYWRGIKSEGANNTNYRHGKDFIEENWMRWENEAIELLEVLERHK